MSRRFFLFIVLFLILLVLAVSLATLNENWFHTDATELESTGILWQHNIKNFATGIFATNNKVYTIDIWGNITCYNSQNGELIWAGTIGAYWGKGVTASTDMVYGGKSSVRVGAVKESTGEFQWEVGTLHDSRWSKKAPSSIYVLEGRLFVTSDSFAVYNATTGKLLWEIVNLPFIQDRNVTFPNWLEAWPFEGNRLFGVGGVLNVGYFVYRLEPDTGAVLWNIPSSTYLLGPPVIYEDQVVMQNETEEKTTVFSLNRDSGAILWSYNVGASIYQPTVTSTGLLLFEASNGNVYALHLSNGTLAWKTHVDSQNITALADSESPLKGLQVQIDPRNQMAIGGFAVTSQLGAFVENGSDEYTGFLYGLNIETGSIVWTTQFSAEGDVSHEGANFDFALTEKNIYLASGFSDFWIFSKSRGKLIESQHLDHYILPPILSNNKVFVAADLYLIAYD